MVFSGDVCSDGTKVIVFDWDDTIIPSSFLDRCQVEQISELPDHVSAPCLLSEKQLF